MGWLVRRDGEMRGRLLVVFLRQDAEVTVFGFWAWVLRGRWWSRLDARLCFACLRSGWEEDSPVFGFWFGGFRGYGIVKSGGAAGKLRTGSPNSGLGFWFGVLRGEWWFRLVRGFASLAFVAGGTPTLLSMGFYFGRMPKLR